MRIKRFVVPLALAATVAIVFGACSTQGTAAPSGGVAAPSGAKALKIGFVTDVGTLDDKSFNEAGWLGTKDAAAALGTTPANIVTKAPADYAANIATFVDQGYDVIVTSGFAMGDATTIAAKKYPKVGFVGTDQGVCILPDGAPDPKFGCKGDADEAPAQPPGPRLQGAAGRLSRGHRCGHPQQDRRHRRGRRHHHHPARGSLHQGLPERCPLGEPEHQGPPDLRVDAISRRPSSTRPPESRSPSR